MDTKHKGSSKNNRSFPVFWGGLIVFVLATIAAGYLSFSTAQKVAASGILEQGGLPVFSNNATPTLQDPLATGVITNTQIPESTPAPVVWDGASRVTVLVMGLDYRDWERNEGPPRTDTMILFTIDPLTKTAGMLNVPRDLWVNIPGFDYAKINTAYPLGVAWQYPDGGGPGLAMATLEGLLGVPIDYYAIIDFLAFERFINEIGGVEIDVPAEIKVDPIGPGNTVILQPGKQTLDGPVSLAYARARYTEGGDFDRAGRQQQVVLAIRNKIISLNMLPTLAAKAPTLYNDLSSGIKTNLTLEQAISLAWLALDVGDENIKRGVISTPDHVLLAKSPDGSQDILKPVTNKIRLLRDEIFASTVPLSEIAQGSSAQDVMKLEGARISVLNGSGVTGLSANTADFLKSQGANVVQTGDAGEYYTYTKIIMYIPKPYTLKYINELVELQPSAIRYEPALSTDVDIVIYLGSDWANAGIVP